ncbi:MAG: 4-(cytidine 5'-diphospho)-2-C-methyl-D-erythritol kinase [Alphaproteobacteria bacterium]|nr:4-(cytidine 5'-diphospho)-2-C-methyl-D-erythritol kinase [Alphaproteobacteria bacterium]
MTDGSDWTPFVEPAPAKINLYLNVTGRRDDGYHYLESLVVFTEFGDLIRLAPAPKLSLVRTGPFAAYLPENPKDDLCLRAAQELAAVLGRDAGVAISLEKNIPVAAGIGGGSADAAAILRALCRAWQIDPGLSQVLQVASRLGADVPVCLRGCTAMMRGVGDIVSPRETDPELDLVLVNPNLPLSAAEVFAALSDEEIASCNMQAPVDANGSSSYMATLAKHRNDLTRPARDLCPDVSDVLQALSGLANCQLARMSGSGPTCFGVFDSKEAAEQAAQEILGSHPCWWVCPTRTQASL